MLDQDSMNQNKIIKLKDITFLMKNAKSQLFNKHLDLVIINTNLIFLQVKQKTFNLNLIDQLKIIC